MGNSLRIAGVVLVAGLIAAACGSSSPSASKKSSGTHTEASGSNKSTTPTTSGTGTTTTTTTGEATTTTTAAAAAAAAGTQVTPTTAKAAATTTTTAAAASTPGGSLSSNTTSTPAATLTGIGASSIQPFYGKVLYEYNQLNHGVSVNFTGSGSGPGVTAIEQDTANFGQSEVPMTAAQLAASKGPVLQVPVDLGGVAISYHVSGVSGPIQLNGPVLAQIYLRTITNWDDPAIAALQKPGVTLPNENIVPVFRSDTSGPGYDLDQYLIDTSPAWTTAIGATAPSTTWPTAGRATGDSGEDLNAGVASYIQETEGAIGYVEYSYALEANFSNAALLNKSGSYVTPSVSSIAAAGATATALSSTNFNIIYGAGGSTYPLANFSWALIYQKQPTTNIGITLGKLFQWVTTSGQSYSSGLGYAPLPTTAVSLAHSTLVGLQTSSGSPIFTS